MIKYRLICANEHEFDGWFADMAAYDGQKADGLLACPHCDNKDVSKAIMAPTIGKKSNQQEADTMAGAEVEKDVRAMMQKMTAHVEENFDYVGNEFAEEARKIHYGETPERDIYGETSPDEARDLLEEGVSVAPLPGVNEKQKN